MITTNTELLSHAQLRELTRELSVELARVQRRMALAADETPADDRELVEHTEHQQALAVQREQLTHALDRVSDGRYGACIGCGAAIPFGKLLLQPDAERCSACATTPVPAGTPPPL